MPSQPRESEKLGSVMDRLGTEANDTNPIGDSLNQTAKTVFEPEQTVQTRPSNFEEEQKSESDGEAPENEGLPPANYDE